MADSRSLVLSRNGETDEEYNQSLRNDYYIDQSQAEKAQYFGEFKTKMCNPDRTKDQLKETLLKKLRELVSDPNCPFKPEMCQEDKHLDRIRNQYLAIMQAQKKHAQERGMTDDCLSGMPGCMKPFGQDNQIRYYRSKLASIRGLSFNFLHKICEDVTSNCNPGETMPEELIDCSLLNQPKSLFFGDRDLASIGRQLAPESQRNGSSPAARGFAPCLFKSGTIAPGSDGLYVCVCTPGRECDGKAKTVMRWTRCNLMEVAAYKTAEEIQRKITARKRQLLQVAREMLKLSGQLHSLHPAAIMQRVKVRPQFCLPAGGASQVVEMGLKRMRVNRMNQLCAEEVKEIRQTLDDQSQLMCGKKFQMPGSRQRKSKSRSKSKGRSKSKSKSRSRSRR